MKEYYGVQDQEILDSEPEEVIQRLMEDEDYSHFPIKVYVFKPMSIAKSEESLSRDIIQDVLERLDENLADPDGDCTEPTEDMKKASLELAKVIFKDYTTWACESTGEVLEYSKEEAENI
jgi:hypothetical protein